MMYSKAFDRSVPCSQYVAKPFPKREKGAAPLEPRLAALAFLAALENYLKRKLEQPRITHLLRLPKCRALVSRVAIHAIELRMVEHVEDLRPELQTHSLPERGVLEQSHVPVVDWRIATNSARNVTKRAKRYVVVKQVWIEHKAVGPRVVGHEWRNQVRFSGAFKSQRTPFQLAIVAVVHQNRKPALIRID